MKISIFILAIVLLLSPLASQAQAANRAKSLGTPNNTTAVKNIRPYTGTSVLEATPSPHQC